MPANIGMVFESLAEGLRDPRGRRGGWGEGPGAVIDAPTEIRQRAGWETHSDRLMALSQPPFPLVSCSFARHFRFFFFFF